MNARQLIRSLRDEPREYTISKEMAILLARHYTGQAEHVTELRETVERECLARRDAQGKLELETKRADMYQARAEKAEQRVSDLEEKLRMIRGIL